MLNKKEQELANRDLELYKREAKIIADEIHANYKSNHRKKEAELEKELADKKAAIDQELLDYKLNKAPEIYALAKKCADDAAKCEHEYHSMKEKRGIELAGIEAKIEIFNKVLAAKEEITTANKDLIRSKDAEIQRLTEIIKELTKMDRNVIVTAPVVNSSK